MSPGLYEVFQRWKVHPKRYDLLFLLGSPVRRYRAVRRTERLRGQLLDPPIDTNNVEILTLPEFRASCRAARGRTLLDVARLANLWYFARMAGEGCFLEVGSYRGGGALHICNAVQERSPRFYCFDPFEDGGFETIGADDQLFQRDQFTDTRFDEVVKLLSGHRNAKVIQGYFPKAAEELDLGKIAFCHLDVDVYDATRASLDFLAERLGPRGLIVVDDMNRKVEGVKRAVAEFVGSHPSFMVIPVFPGQALLFSTELWRPEVSLW